MKRSDIAKMAENDPELAQELDRIRLASTLRSVLTFFASRVLTPERLAEQYDVVLDEFKAADLQYAADTLSVMARRRAELGIDDKHSKGFRE